MPALQLFLKNDFTKTDFEKNRSLLEKFSKLDDTDIMACIKVWCDEEDIILSKLCCNLMDRRLYKIELQNERISASYKKELLEKVCKKYGVSKKEAAYFVVSDSVNNSAYNSNALNIHILMGNGQLVDVAKASDQLNLQSLSKTVTKYFICYPKGLV